LRRDMGQVSFWRIQKRRMCIRRRPAIAGICRAYTGFFAVAKALFARQP
jgi:hypothetical protein